MTETSYVVRKIDYITKNGDLLELTMIWNSKFYTVLAKFERYTEENFFFKEEDAYDNMMRFFFYFTSSRLTAANMRFRGQTFL